MTPTARLPLAGAASPRPPLRPAPAGRSRHRRSAAFTLVEILIATTVGTLVLAAVGSMLVVSARLTHKNQQIGDASATTRIVQEHVNRELSLAISQTSPVQIRPTFTNPNGTVSPIRYATMSYRVPIGTFATVISDTANTSNTVAINCPADLIPKAGDYFLMDSPNLGAGIRITAVSPENSSGNVTVTLASTLAAGTVDDPVGALANKLVRLQRERKYETVAPSPSTNPVTELRWFENSYSTDYVVLSKNVDAASRYLFAQIPEDGATAALEPSVSWQFSYLSPNGGANLAGGNQTYYQTNYAEGLIMPKSGNPLAASSILGGGSTTSTTTSTTTSSTTSSTTTTSKTTSTSTTSTTSKTTTTTSTSKTTTTSTSTSATTTKSTTSTSTSKTTSTSTTSKSTTSTSATTTSSKSTTSTSKSTTTSTTSKSTTSTSTSATTTSTTSKTTTTSTTSKSTTSTTSSKTTTTSTTSTTSKSTTTSIPFDGE